MAKKDIKATDEAIDELEQFESEYNESFDDENFDNDGSYSRDLTDERPAADDDEVKVESGQESDTDEAASQDQEPEVKPKSDERAFKVPDDEEAFGEFAGKELTYDELWETGLLEKFKTWGYQGRHMIKRGQEELDESRKIREAIEKQLELQKQQVEAANRPPELTPEQHAKRLTDTFLPDIQKYAEAGGIESTFVDNYPKVAAMIENRFQAASQLASALIDVVDKMKTNVDPMQEERSNNFVQNTLKNLASDVSKTNELFSFLGKDEEYGDFMKWATAEDSTLHWVDQDVRTVTPQDISSAALLYMHQHPEKFQKRPKPKNEEDRRLASGGPGQTKPSARKPRDEYEAFERELAESYQDQDF